jgi:hypothetical protein
METSFLNKTFDYTQELINKNPENEDKLISEYIDFIIKVKSNNNKPFVRSPVYTDKDDLISGNVRIRNNFQKYNSQEPIFIPTTPANPNSPPVITPIPPPETTVATFRNNIEGFKGYYR